MEAGERYGYPFRVHSDHGSENVDVAQLILMLRGPNQGSHITGRLVNNIRMERLWRDMLTQCVSLYYHLFYNLEDSGILNPNDPLHLFALNYAYLHCANKCLFG